MVGSRPLILEYRAGVYVRAGSGAQPESEHEGEQAKQGGYKEARGVDVERGRFVGNGVVGPALSKLLGGFARSLKQGDGMLGHELLKAMQAEGCEGR